MDRFLARGRLAKAGNPASELATAHNLNGHSHRIQLTAHISTLAIAALHRLEPVIEKYILVFQLQQHNDLESAVGRCY
jgi:hypothetical protein